MGLPDEAPEVIGSVEGYVTDCHVCETIVGHCASFTIETPDGSMRVDATLPVTLRRDFRKLIGFEGNPDGFRMPVRLVLETAPDAAFAVSGDGAKTSGAMDASLEVLAVADGLVVSDLTTETGEPTWVIEADVPEDESDARAVTHDGVSWAYQIMPRKGSEWDPIDPVAVGRFHRFTERFKRFSGYEVDVLGFLSRAKRYRTSVEDRRTVTIRSQVSGTRWVTATGRPPYGKGDWEYSVEGEESEGFSDVMVEVLADVRSFIGTLTDKGTPWARASLPKSRTR